MGDEEDARDELEQAEPEQGGPGADSGTAALRAMKESSEQLDETVEEARDAAHAALEADSMHSPGMPEHDADEDGPRASGSTEEPRMERDSTKRGPRLDEGGETATGESEQ